MNVLIRSFITVFVLAFSTSGITGCTHQELEQEKHSMRGHQSSGVLLPTASYQTGEKDWSRNRTCTYYHEQSHGNMWKTTWC